MTGWQPIETAPRDGTEVLCTWMLTVDGVQHWSGTMHVLSWWKNWGGCGCGTWVLDGDFSVRFEPDGVHETPPISCGDPTHWMPLPQPPSPPEAAA